MGKRAPGEGDEEVGQGLRGGGDQLRGLLPDSRGGCPPEIGRRAREWHAF